MISDDQDLQTNFIRLIDFGYAVDLNYPLSESLQKLLNPFVIGTPYYVAPEMLEKDESETKIESDMWAIGVTVYQLLTGKYPFDTTIGREDLNKRIQSCNYRFPENWKHGPDCQDFIEKLLEPTVKRRLTPEAALNHPWLQW